MSIADDLIKSTKKVTKKWERQRKSEIRNSRSRSQRRETFSYDRAEYMTEASEVVTPQAYAQVSGTRNLHANARQIFYKARPQIQQRTGKTLRDDYFTQTLLPKYIADHPEETKNWKVVYDARGHLVEPHYQWRRSEPLALGTIEVDRYLRDCHVGADVELAFPQYPSDFPTAGPRNRYRAVLYIEKEGFAPLFEEVRLAERYDIAIMSCKGQSVVAGRRLVDELCHGDVPLLILHDFDKAGFLISERLVQTSFRAQETNTERYRFRNKINAIDLGLRLSDIEEWGLEPEECEFKGGFDSDSIATQEEQEFLHAGQRVELNAFNSEDFITWIEGKLKEHGIEKVIPDKDDLEVAYRRAMKIAHVNEQIRENLDRAEEIAANAQLPPGLRQKIESRLKKDPTLAWDRVLADIAVNNLDDADDSAS
ncbi:hypothetical protein [Symmachiella dynata]|uniref:hypothetical protein n=1 Tax=Symmachiella dynata TaxID=2527995 RepID=UPI0011A510D4|nr:hypothetical protein [Symmachiella dynata]